MIELKTAGPADRTLLWNLLQKYLCEMTNYYDNELDGEGNFPYRYFEDYFRESEREALLILSDGRIAGFALLNGHSYIGGQPDRVLGEFFVLPSFRRRHVAARAAEMIFARGGSWEVKYNTKNLPAATLWTKLTEKYRPRAIDYSECEIVLSFDTRDRLRLVPAGPGRLPDVYRIIDERIRWMDEKGLRQWNVTGYWLRYPREYYARLAEAGQLYALIREDGTAAGVCALLDTDPHWAGFEGDSALYLHHFASDPREKGAGRIMLREAEAIAREMGVSCLRLDCAVDNPFLNDYYERAGYRVTGSCVDGAYRGRRREKPLKDAP